MRPHQVRSRRNGSDSDSSSSWAPSAASDEIRVRAPAMQADTSYSAHPTVDTEHEDVHKDLADSMIGSDDERVNEAVNRHSSNRSEGTDDLGANSNSNPMHDSDGEADHEDIDFEDEPNVGENEDNYADAGSIPHMGHMPMKRSRKPYTYRSRIPAKKKGPPRASLWVKGLQSMTLSKFRRTTCCKSFKCFRRANYQFYMTNAKRILPAPTYLRRRILESFLGSDKKYRFDGRIVCVLFLKTCFHFGTDLIAEVSSGEVRRQSPSLSSSSHLPPSASSSRGSGASIEEQSAPMSAGPSLATNVKKREAIMSYIMRLAEDCGDFMPHKTEVHLPFYRYQEIFPLFKTNYKTLYPTLLDVTETYFRRIWREEFPHIKVMKWSRFTTCDTCDQLRVALRKKIVAGESTTQIKKRRKAHTDFVATERLEYQKKKDRARLASMEYCFIILDGADQSAFGIPHFATTTKNQSGHAMKVKLVGLLEHQLQNRLHLYSMTQEHATGANHVVEVLHRFINAKRAHGTLPRKMFIQLDNCSRENKNRYVMGYLEFLVASKAFESVEDGFLPVGHTHEDVDQAFSQTSARLRIRDAITIGELHTELRCTYGGQVHVEHMRRLANWSGLCDEEHCLRNIDRITYWRYFLFSPMEIETTDNAKADAAQGDSKESKKHTTMRTICHVKKNCDNPWVRLFTGSEQRGILKSHPKLENTPDLRITCPDGVADVTKRLESEDGRVNCAAKMIELHELRDFVFQARMDKFHWDLENVVETEHNGNNPGPDLDGISRQCSDGIVDPDLTTVQLPLNNTDSEARISSEQPTNKVDYRIGSFVVVQASGDDADADYEEAGSDEQVSAPIKYYVGKVVQIQKASGSLYATHLKLHWYDDNSVRRGDDIFTYKFDPCYQPSKQKARAAGPSSKIPRAKLQQPWYDVVHTDTVVVAFESLTRRRALPLSVQKKLT